MASKKSCKHCKTIIEEGNKCPNCGSNDLTETWKGKIVIVNPQESEIAKKLKIEKAGTYAIKTK